MYKAVQILILSLLYSVHLFGQKQVDAARVFTQEQIPDSVWQLMQGKTYQENPYIGRNDLRYLRISHYDNDGAIHVGEMVVASKIAPKVLEIFQLLYKAKYPIERMVLPDNYDADDEKQMKANNTSCFCYRTTTGGKKLSKHARGLAIDINPLYNPYVKVRSNGSLHVQPATATPYCDRSKQFPYKINRGDLAYKLFTERGFVWGGSWKSLKDYHHFELKE